MGSQPYKLDFGLTYKAAPTGCNTYGPCTGAIQGGWNHRWDVRLSNSGSGTEALGATSPFAASGTLAAYVAGQSLPGFQVGTLPYKLVVDPPWEAEYDLGYYRPGDRIPPDTIMITPTGVGPPLKGRQY